ncbi:hypothetical protein Salat_2081500 [Sesamum alatum]|uniref:CCHC-type domain-containing protein n=1 Tax=Sesamum alatum TaxID=300844 RepID=A0AAE2CGL9_9LAMI|nr:hypothetical protein Salat_2081500 [Sesamum alatum]
MASHIGHILGDLVQIELDDRMSLVNAIVKIKVSLDINKPLRRVMQLRLLERDDFTIRLTYARLPNFCFLCGKMRHIARTCEKQYEDGFTDPGTNTPYGAWLRHD